MANKALFSEWFKAQQERKDVVGAAAVVWFRQHGLDRRGRVNAERLTRQAGISPESAKAVIEAYAAV